MNSDRTHGHLLFALRRVLRSLARLLIRFGIQFDEFAALVQAIFIESTVRDFSHSSRPSRDRIAAVTGLTRHQVDNHIDFTENHLPSEPTMADILVEILHKWHTTPFYVGPYGIPLELEFSTPTNRCFCSLVALVDPKVNAGRALQDLQLAGAVTQPAENRFRAVSRSLLMSAPASPELIEHFGMTVWRLAEAMEYNMEPNHVDKRLQRRVSADRGLPLELVPAFEKYARNKTTEFLLDLDNWLALQPIGDSTASDQVDAGVNVFFYVKSPVSEDPLALLVSAPEGKTSANR